MFERIDFSTKTDNDVNNDIDLCLKLIVYGQSFNMHDIWRKRTGQSLYILEPVEWPYISRCKNVMFREGIIDIVDRKEFEKDDVLQLTQLGQKIKKTGWKKHLSKVKWGVVFTWTHRTLTLGLLGVTIYYTIKDHRTSSEVDNLKGNIQSIIQENKRTNQSLTDSLTSLRDRMNSLETKHGQK